LILPFYITLGWETPIIIFALYFATKCIGSEVGAHRLWSHRSYATRPWIEKILIVLDTFAGEGSILAFAGIHRLHHQYSDTVDDPHNPHTHPWRTTFFQHNTDKFNARLIKDLIANPWLVWQHKNYFKIQTVILLTLSLVSITALWYYAVNVLVTIWTDFLVDVVCHRWGSNDNGLSNTSKNNRWAGIFLMGAHLHNNHHARPGEWNNAWGQYKFDLWAQIIRLIKV
jgi:stearoyl-CoA desaturase (delta-9 desaturase)